MTSTARHRWGPAPSGEPQHRATCRRCGLEEISTWGRRPDGEVVEVVAWVAPTGQVVAERPVTSRKPPSGLGPLPVVEDQGRPDTSAVDLLTHCPGTSAAWES